MTERIAVVPGDGIGVEVTAAARAVLDAAAAKHGLDLAYDEYDWSCRRYTETGSMMPSLTSSTIFSRRTEQKRVRSSIVT